MLLSQRPLPSCLRYYSIFEIFHHNCQTMPPQFVTANTYPHNAGPSKWYLTFIDSHILVK